MSLVPPAFAARLVDLAGEEARPWLDGLDRTVRGLCADWALAPAGPPRHGTWALALPVTGPQGEAVLRVSYPGAGGPLADAVAAYRAWEGRGAARLYRVDLERQALLLERLDAGRSLEPVAVNEALPVAGGLLRTLAVPAPPGLPRLEALAADLAAGLRGRWERLGRPFGPGTLDRAERLADELGGATAGVIVNWDLHFADILWDGRGWRAVDPAVLAGDLEYGLAQLLWTRLEAIEAGMGVRGALDRLVDSAGLDPGRARAWAFTRSLDYALWGLERGLTFDPERCRRIAAALEPLL